MDITVHMSLVQLRSPREARERARAERGKGSDPVRLEKGVPHARTRLPPASTHCLHVSLSVWRTLQPTTGCDRRTRSQLERVSLSAPRVLRRTDRKSVGEERV